MRCRLTEAGCWRREQGTVCCMRSEESKRPGEVPTEGTLKRVARAPSGQVSEHIGMISRCLVWWTLSALSRARPLAASFLPPPPLAPAASHLPPPLLEPVVSFSPPPLLAPVATPQPRLPPTRAHARANAHTRLVRPRLLLMLSAFSPPPSPDATSAPPSPPSPPAPPMTPPGPHTRHHTHHCHHSYQPPRH